MGKNTRFYTIPNPQSHPLVEIAEYTILSHPPHIRSNKTTTLQELNTFANKQILLQQNRVW